MPDEEIVSGSQTETTPAAPERDAETESLYAQFDIKPTAEKKEIVFPDLSKGEISGEEGQPPAIEETPTEPKKLTVKFNKEDVSIDEDKIPEYVQKGLALDKERERKTELEKTLDRAAKLAGFKDQAEYTANLDKLEQQQQQQVQDDFNKLKADLRQEFIDNGFDPVKAEAWLDNHPVIQKAQEAIQKDEARSLQDNQAKTREQTLKGWQTLYTEYPDLVESSALFNEGKEPEWFNAEMKSRYEKGYDPLDAYKLAHSSTIQAQSARKTEQKIIKQQHLGARSLVEGQGSSEPNEVTLLPEQMALAAEFGVDIKGVTQQQKLLSSRR